MTAVFAYIFHIKSLEKENLYKEKNERQNFVFELSQALQERVYNAEVFFWNIRDEARSQTIYESWDRYKSIILKWNEKLQNNYIKLDIYFPKEKYLICNYSNSLKEKISFRDFLEKEIQKEFIPIHGELVDLKKVINLGEPFIVASFNEKGSLKELQRRIEKLHVKIANYIEALAKASRR